MIRILIAVLALPAVLLGAHVYAGEFVNPLYQYTDDDKSLMQTCLKGTLKESPSLEGVLSGCTLVILDPAAAPEDKAHAYVMRAAGRNTDRINAIVADMHTAISLAPRMWEAYYLRGMVVWLGAGNVAANCPGEAQSDLSRAIEYGLDKSSIEEAYRVRATCRARNGDVDAAAADFEVAAAIDGAHAVDYLRMAAGYLKDAGHHTGASKLWERNVGRFPGNRDVQIEYVRALVDSDRAARAIGICSANLRQHPESGVWLIERGKAYEAFGERDKAIADYRAVLALTQELRKRDWDWSPEEFETVRVADFATWQLRALGITVESEPEIPVIVE